MHFHQIIIIIHVSAVLARGLAGFGTERGSLLLCLSEYVSWLKVPLSDFLLDPLSELDTSTVGLLGMSILNELGEAFLEVTFE